MTSSLVFNWLFIIILQLCLLETIKYDVMKFFILFLFFTIIQMTVFGSDFPIETDSIASEKYVMKGLEKKELSDFIGAKNDFTKAIELDPTNFDAYLNRALLKEATSDLVGAIDDYSKVIELNPSIVIAHVNRGFLKWSLKNYYDAIIDFSQAIKIDPKNGEAYFYRGMVKHHLDQNDNGCNDLNKAKTLGFDISQEELNRFCE